MTPLALSLLFPILAASAIESHAVAAQSSRALNSSSLAPNIVAAAPADAGGDGFGAPPSVSAGVEPQARVSRRRNPATPRTKHRGKRPHICAVWPGACQAMSPDHVCCFGHFCRDLSRDNFNCGACGHWCWHRRTCCGGYCTDTRMDRNHCGRCWRACPPDESCVFGMCGYG